MTPNYPVPQPYKARTKRRKMAKLSPSVDPSFSGLNLKRRKPAPNFMPDRGAAAGHKVYRAKRRPRQQATGY